ncbi:enoyl-CoA hydratase/isomerase family protein [Cupriavidus oxalaticus]|uniref:enoyl-CoA hydratase/isomerase family protein n=1 Tax=Cupriavidus oxalaticus TaxID=96344 RepID=UPI00319E9499
MMAAASFSIEGDVGVLTLNNPPLNLWSLELMADWKASVDDAYRSAIRALVVRAEGPFFSGGADVKIFQGMSTKAAREMFELYLPVIRKLETLPFPTIAAVQGLCLAAGMELVLACDLIWAGESARLGQTEAMIATSTLLGGIQRITARAGAARAKEMVFSGAQYDSHTLERWNIVNRVVPDDQLNDEVMKYAKVLAAGPTASHMVGKELIRKYLTAGLDAADQHVLDAAMPLFETVDMQHGVETLVEHGVRNLAARARFIGK